MPKDAKVTRKGRRKVREKILAEKMRRVRFFAKTKVPVDTGFLRSRINIEEFSDGWLLNVDAYYAAFVEYGTSKMSPQPYVRPAIKKVFGDG